MAEHGARNERLFGLDRLAIVRVYSGIVVLFDARRVARRHGHRPSIAPDRSLQIVRSQLIVICWTLAEAVVVPAILVHDFVVGMASFTLALTRGDVGRAARLWVA